ncbi:MAG TPA: RluA family pseudouridine synthase [Tenuifilaceae bacterium]|nr:RluA family pseudouridine synthase [Tenuifilaceae bacterium]HPM89772.1 RluA family pseudouridine synthase [Tenuifilaceae bacterium]HPW25766.1 RluA family pseudouridine synthase [Tenuifilaceae bacterium]
MIDKLHPFFNGEVDEETDEQAELYEHFHFDVDRGQAQIRIDRFLTDKIKNVSRNRIQSAADAGNIVVNGKPVKPSYKVKPLDSISIVMAYPPRDTDIKPENIPLSILYEDDSLLVVDKPAGMVVHPAHGNFSGTLVNALLYHLRDVPLFSSGEVRPGLVHRIDKNTSGILVVAKDEVSMNRLARQFFERTTSRKYIALVWGDMEADEGTIKGNIGRSVRDRKKMQVFTDEEQGKHAVTHWRVVERFGYVTLVECRLETGRTHQIRVHFEYIHHPIFNDEVYGGNKILRGTLHSHYKQFVENCFEICPRHALHAKTLGFTHPLSGMEMNFESPLPNDISALIEKWKKYSTGKYSEK